MICPKCGVFFSDGREICPGCGTRVSRDPFYPGFKESGSDQQYTVDQAGAGVGGQYPGAPVATGGRSRGKMFVGVLLIIVIIFVAIIGATFMNRVVLEIVEIDTSGSDMIITIKNKGWDDAEGGNIKIRCNGEDDYKWPTGDIESGKKKTAEIQVVFEGLHFIFDVEVFYEGYLQDSRG